MWFSPFFLITLCSCVAQLIGDHTYNEEVLGSNLSALYFLLTVLPQFIIWLQ